MAAEFKSDAIAHRGHRTARCLVTSVFLLDQAICTSRYLNAAAQTLLGLSSNQALGRSITELTRGAETLLPLFDRAAQGGEGVVQRELAWPAPGGVDRILDCAVTKCSSAAEPAAAAGNRGHHPASAPDPRERVAGAIGRQPLDGPPARARNQKSARRLARRGATARAGTVGSGVAGIHPRHHQRSGSSHQFAGLHARARPPALEAVDQRARIAGARLSFAAQRGAEGVTVDRDYDPSLPPLRVDPNHIIQAMLNLGRNAIQALSSGQRWSRRA